MGNMRAAAVGALVAAASLPAAVARVAAIRNGTTSVVDGVAHTMDAEPALPHDENASPYCTWWLDNYGSEVCEDIPDWWGISMDDFVRWNPSVGEDCSGFESGKSYCVEATGEPPVTTTKAPPVTTPPPTTTSSSTVTTTDAPTPTNGIPTPSPIEPGMVENCDAFHLVESGDGCASITKKYGISQGQFAEWNTQVGTDCAGLWLNYYVCVSVIGHEASPTTTDKPTPTNGIPTPSPVEPGIVGNCDEFHLVESGDGCASITQKYGISQDQFAAWNTQVGKDCSGLWLGYYVCVSTIGHEPSPTTTSKPSPTNGIATPSPVEPGMVDNCDAFHAVASGDTCQAITQKYGISQDELARWNAQVGQDCSGLWLDYYICVSVVGHEPKPTPTQPPGNGVATPTPTQPGMVGNCDTFHLTQRGENCESIAKLAGVDTRTFISWNPAVGNDCSGLWLDTYCCIGLI